MAVKERLTLGWVSQLSTQRASVGCVGFLFGEVWTSHVLVMCFRKMENYFAAFGEKCKCSQKNGVLANNFVPFSALTNLKSLSFSHSYQQNQ